MSDWIFYMHSNLSSAPWDGNGAAAAPTSPPTPCLYHVLYQGCGETQMVWHGETYCLVGGYRAYGDAPLATPAKVEAEEPVPRQVPKRHQAVAELDKATLAKVEAEKPVPRRAPKRHRAGAELDKVTLAKVEAGKPVPRRAPKRHRAGAESDQDLGCPGPNIRTLQHGGRRLTPQKVTG
ncbi:DPEP2 neighbor protein-like [Equus przewalskii]|uniref:DPEP2 neighbor protein-like n=1 Tax=Equus przewalskii TaxID=9798 RepID=A0ABM4M8W7_EQUPR